MGNKPEPVTCSMTHALNDIPGYLSRLLRERTPSIACAVNTSL